MHFLTIAWDVTRIIKAADSGEEGITPQAFPEGWYAIDIKVCHKDEGADYLGLVEGGSAYGWIEWLKEVPSLVEVEDVLYKRGKNWERKEAGRARRLEGKADGVRLLTGYLGGNCWFKWWR